MLGMPLSLQHRYAVLLADRTRDDVRTITTVVTEMLAANPETTPLENETALRAAAGQVYLAANSTTAGFEIMLGMPAWHAALADAGLTVEQNWGVLVSRIAQLDQRTAPPGPMPALGGADVRPTRRKSGFDPKATSAACATKFGRTHKSMLRTSGHRP